MWGEPAAVDDGRLHFLENPPFLTASSIRLRLKMTTQSCSLAVISASVTPSSAL